jgi:DNA primase
MTSEQANNISIKQFLSSLNIFSVKEKDHYGMYRSPFRPDAEPSFKVDYRQNLWYDFGTGEGGTMIDLVIKINHCTFAEAIRKLGAQAINSEFFSFHGKDLSNESNIHIIKILPLANSALLSYLSERKISNEAARQQCCEVHYTVAGKVYFAIGFANNTGGYELRNKYFKGCISPKDITSITKNTDTCVVFEGFMDYLSYLTLKQQLHPQTNIVVLNSIILLNRAMDFIKQHTSIHVCMDNDEAGKQAVTKIKNVCGNVSDQSGYYKNHKDLNAFLCDGMNIKRSAEKPKLKMKR